MNTKFVDSLSKPKSQVSILLAILFAGTAFSQVETPPGKKPSVLFIGGYGGGCGFEVANKLAQAGFALNGTPYPGLTQTPLVWDKVKNYNAIVATGIGQANADMTLPDKVKQTIETLNKYLEAGGGVLIFPAFGQMVTDKPPQDTFLKPLGLTPLFDETIFDSEAVPATSWKLPYAYTEAITESPVAVGVKALWFVVQTRAGAQNHATPCAVDETWTVVVKGSRTSQTKKGPLQQVGDQPGTYPREVPLVAVKQVGKGRIMYLGLTAEYLIGAHATNTLEGIALERGLRGKPSGGYKLLENGLKWLAEPSLAAGDLGGATMDAAMLKNPHKTEFGQPWGWTDKLEFPAVEAAYPGVIGARTRYSSGKATVDEWVAKAKEKKLAYIVFLEEFARLSAENFAKLKADCARLSSEGFSAIPGLTIDDEVGNHYFYFGTTFPYPDKKFLSEDGKVFRARDPEINQKDPYVKGQLAMTTLDYAYSISSFKLTARNYLFTQDAAPFSDFFSDWDAIGVVTARGGKLVEDSTEDFLKIVDSGQGPLPLALDLMDSPAQLDASKWRTVLRFPTQGGMMVGGFAIEQATKIRDYFNPREEWNASLAIVLPPRLGDQEPRAADRFRD